MSEHPRSKARMEHDKLVIELDESARLAAEACLNETGRITIGIREVSVTKLGEPTDAMVIVN